MADDTVFEFDATVPPTDSFNDPAFHLDVLDELVEPANSGAVPLASFPDNRYPYVYPRDVASISRAWLAALRADLRPELCRDRIADAARFLLDAGEDGRWRQRYDLDGADASLYRQEDNVAHGVRVLSHAVVALAETDALDGADEEFTARIVRTLRDAVALVREELYDPNAHLVESTTSIHEGRIESGYTLWVNCAFVAALRLAERAADHVADADASVDEATDALTDRLEEFRPLLERGVERAFADPRGVPRRFTPDGERDDRPDVTLLAPYYFDLGDRFGDALDEAAERAATALADPELGGLQRFRGFHRDFTVHQHGGTGPWMQYTAWHAQYRFDRGDRRGGESVLATVAEHAGENGHVPEHLTTAERFAAFVEEEWDTGRDFEKEFDDAVLRDVPFDRVVEELGHMKRSYDEIAERTAERDVVAFAAPLGWSHAEYLVALLRRRSIEEG
jgi:GH15 family glucan-1,4-alpha-glucosidase